MKRSTIVTAVVLLCLIVGSILCIQSIIGEDPEPTATPTPAATPEPLATPTPTLEPTPTPPPTPTPRPTPTPAPTPTPTPALPPSAEEVSGSFRSDTGTGLNILVEWMAYPTGDGKYRMAVDVSTVSYSFFTDALFESVEIKVGEDRYFLSSAKVDYDGTDLAVTPLASKTLETGSGSVPVSVVWSYKGTYSGVELESITASGTAQLP